MGPIQAVKSLFQNCTTFSGRAIRSEFWWPQLFYIIVYIGLIATENSLLNGHFFADQFGILSTPFELVLWIPMLALSVRRFHDIGATGALPFAISVLSLPMYIPGFGNFAHGSIAEMLEIALLVILVLCVIVLIYFATRKSDPNTNKYGPNPLEVSA